MLGGWTQTWPLWVQISVVSLLIVSIPLMWIREILGYFFGRDSSGYTWMERREIRRARARKVARDRLEAEAIVRAHRGEDDDGDPHD